MLKGGDMVYIIRLNEQSHFGRDVRPRASKCIEMHHFLRLSQLRDPIETDEAIVTQNYPRLPIRGEAFHRTSWRGKELRFSVSTTWVMRHGAQWRSAAHKGAH